MPMPAIMLSTMSLALEQHAWAYWAKHFGLATTHLVLRLCLIKVHFGFASNISWLHALSQPSIPGCNKQSIIKHFVASTCADRFP